MSKKTKMILKWVALGYAGAVGLAVWRSGAGFSLQNISTFALDPRMTFDIAVNGPGVSAAEQAANDAVDAAADLFA